MKEEDLKAGEVYEFKAGARRIVSFDYGVGRYNTYVVWEYADGMKRQGRAGGRTWMPSFAAKAKVRTEQDALEEGYVCYWFSQSEREAIVKAVQTLGADEHEFAKEAVLRKARKVIGEWRPKE